MRDERRVRRATVDRNNAQDTLDRARASGGVHRVLWTPGSQLMLARSPASDIC